MTHNLGQSFADMTAQSWIRLVIIVGAYLLIRPYLVKLGTKLQEKQYDKEAQEPMAKISPNELRGKVHIPEDSDDDQAESTAADWGKKSRRRQREVMRKLLDAEGKRLREAQEDEEDKDIEQYLVD